MKKLATLLLAAGMVFGAATGASAIDFKAKGQWIMEFTGADNTNFTEDGYGRDGKNDNFDARQRVRLQLDAVASEALSGTVYFEMGDQVWGQAKSGGALGADGKVVEVKQAYIDWIVPNTDLKLRMGLQGIKLPNFANGASQILDDDMAGITASYAFNENVAVTAFWARLYNDNGIAKKNADGGYTWYNANENDNADMFALLVPMTFDGVKVTPWVAYAAIGANTTNFKELAETGPSLDWFNRGIETYKPKKANDVNPYYDFIAAGLTGEITMADPFRFAWDFNYASLTTGDDYAKRQGWYGTILGEYKMDWGTPGLYAWYASGEDGDHTNGSEQMPYFDPNGTDGYSNLANSGNKYLAPNEALLGRSWQGTWGIGARVKDVSFLDGLKHTFRVNFIQGTNDKDGVRNLRSEKVYINNLSTDESALEIGLSNSYKVYENLDFYTDFSYLALWQDENLRKGVSQADAWNATAAFVYSF
ncbi:MAG: outer membrane homotrimeric porin [Desulfovibrionaceae bacterium]|nr:outer membrane homotrimeric porin [Desulfovibrionaceae bacterium]